MALGKGLSSLIAEDTMSQINQAYIANLPIEQILPNPYQPRTEIKPETLVELADSLREHGVIEPLIVTKKSEGKYELIAGERRWRAAKLAKMPTVPVVVKEASPQQMLELAIVENIQRKDLNPLEEALAFEQLIKMFKLGQGDIAVKVGYSRPAIANKMRLLTLPEQVKKLLIDEKISEGHARAILGLVSKETMVEAAKITVRDKLSVRAVEELVRRLNQGHKTKPKKRNERILDEYTQTIESRLRKSYGEKVSLQRSARGGKIVIPFKNDDELKKIYKQLTD
ncbi:MAG: ParB/RepB/Spo0J family partition protein [Candidatus Dojkabacteria bacterium]|uniref:ParB/RepB/Spo0J family partition protein n=2 Tax=Candidatus Dojkabacteria TaxID=74243 RepID=A0A952DVF8_9BACT|nr:MAG: putative chromosome-partitioning protein ParB [candidate division WS6 bacterium OLB21]MBW7953415.1 ParB/RepB/Spo0J family partition protein [Candidatus Dojkabacteria bacterium]WKZ27620.1 MAG: ParB/RepB/Spo0J family partition protein [Candidatus Dojkabacteria bacterium]